jgi:hypothetical protein
MKRNLLTLLDSNGEGTARRACVRQEHLYAPSAAEIVQWGVAREDVAWTMSGPVEARSWPPAVWEFTGDIEHSAKRGSCQSSPWNRAKRLDAQKVR